MQLAKLSFLLLGICIFLVGGLQSVAAHEGPAHVHTSWTEPVTGMEFVFVPGGCFLMGDVFGDGYDYNKPAHEVCVNDYFLGKYEVTQGQWQKIMKRSLSEQRDRIDKAKPLSGVGENHPIYYISWHDVQEFLTQLVSQSGKQFRLPTEAEWEYAARSGGQPQKFAGGSSIDAVAWYKENSNGTTHPVGSKQPNAIGLYDMSGNVLEWMQDWYDDDYYASSPRLNPQGPVISNNRSHRGGGWAGGSYNATTVNRGCSSPDRGAAKDIGFRVLMPAGQIEH